MKKLIFILLLGLVSSLNAQVGLDLSVASRNLWRGLNQGQAPSFQADLYGEVGNVTAGTFITQTLNGRTTGFGNTREVYISVTLLEKLTITLDDYFFDSRTNYLHYNNHFPEARISFEEGPFEFMVGFDIKSEEFYINPSYSFKDFTVELGMVTGASNVNFYSQGGMCLIGLSYSKQILSNVTVDVVTQFNPNYKNITVDEHLPASPLNGAVVVKWSL